jgi:sterol desaturase/sphingolipid hydroxylase (fatty acid hydroxylase superfamily)
MPFLTLYAILIHADLDWDFGPLRYVLATPRFHRWRHTSEEEGLDRNFSGLLPLWDLMFDTFYMPQSRPQHFGVRGMALPASLPAQLLWPFREASRPAALPLRNPDS